MIFPKRESDPEVLTKLVERIKVTEAKSSKQMNPLEKNIVFLRDLIAFAYEQGYHEHGYNVLEEALQQVRAQSETKSKPVFPTQEVADCVECDLKIMIVSDTKAKVDAARTKIVDLVLDVPAIHDVMVTVTGAKQELR